MQARRSESCVLIGWLANIAGVQNGPILPALDFRFGSARKKRSFGHIINQIIIYELSYARQ